MDCLTYMLNQSPTVIRSRMRIGVMTMELSEMDDYEPNLLNTEAYDDYLKHRYSDRDGHLADVDRLRRIRALHATPDDLSEDRWVYGRVTLSKIEKREMVMAAKARAKEKLKEVRRERAIQRRKDAASRKEAAIDRAKSPFKVHVGELVLYKPHAGGLNRSAQILEQIESPGGACYMVRSGAVVLEIAESEIIGRL